MSYFSSFVLHFEASGASLLQKLEILLTLYEYIINIGEKKFRKPLDISIYNYRSDPASKLGENFPKISKSFSWLGHIWGKREEILRAKLGGEGGGRRTRWRRWRRLLGGEEWRWGGAESLETSSLPRSLFLSVAKNWSQFQSAFDVSVTAFDLRDNESKTDVDQQCGSTLWTSFLMSRGPLVGRPIRCLCCLYFDFLFDHIWISYLIIFPKSYTWQG